jgi:hypothetical protein
MWGRNGGRDARGHRFDERMRALVAVSQPVRRTVWKAHLVPLGMRSWKTRSRVFGAILDWMGIGADVFDGCLTKVEKSSVFTSQQLVYSKLAKRHHAQRIGVSGGGDCKGQ